MEILASMLKKFGLNASEAKVYAALLVLQDAKASDIAKQARVPRNKLYEIAESLNKKGFVEIIPEKVMKFRAVPFDTVCDVQISSMKRQTEEISRSRDEVVQRIRKVSEPQQERGYFAVLRSRKVIRKKLEEMSDSSESMTLLMNISDMRNLINIMKRAAKTTRINVIVPVNKESTPLVRKWTNFSEVRHYETSMQEKIAVTKDSVLIYELSTPLALYSNDPKFVTMFNNFLESEWNAAVQAEDKIREIETGKPPEEMIFIRGRENLYKALPELFRETKKDFIIMTSEKGIMRIHKYLNKYFEEARQRGVKTRVITSVTKDNMDVARSISAEVAHADRIHAAAACFDDRRLVMMDIKDDVVSRNSPQDTVLITNNSHTVKMMRQMLERSWADAVPLEGRISEITKGKREEMKVIIGTEKIHKLLLEMAARAKNSVDIMSTPGTLKRSFERGTWDIDKSLSEKVKVRYLLPITEKNVDIVKKAMEFAEIRHIDFTPIRMRMVDGEECTMRYGDEKVYHSMEICVYSNIQAYVSNIKKYFDFVWKSAVPAEQRIRQLEKTKSEVSIIVDSSQQLAKYPIKDMHDKGMTVKILLPVKPEDSEYLEQLGKYAEIRHVPETFIDSIQADKREILFDSMWQSAQPLKERVAETER